MRFSTGCRAGVARRNVRNDLRSAIARLLPFLPTTRLGDATLQRLLVLDRHDAHELPHELFPVRENVPSVRATRVFRVSFDQTTDHALLAIVQEWRELQ